MIRMIDCHRGFGCCVSYESSVCHDDRRACAAGWRTIVGAQVLVQDALGVQPLQAAGD